MVIAHNFVKWAGFRIDGAEPLGFTAGEPISPSVYIISVFSNETIMTIVDVISCLFNTMLYIIYASND
jgi:hypothetical protein